MATDSNQSKPLPMKFEFDPKMIARLEADFKALHLSPKHEKLAQMYVDVVKGNLGLPASAVKACVWEAIRRWQNVHGDQVAKYEGKPLSKRVKVMLELSFELFEVLREFLPNQEQKKRLQETITKAFEEYRKKFA